MNISNTKTTKNGDISHLRLMNANDGASHKYKTIFNFSFTLRIGTKGEHNLVILRPI